MTKNIALPLNIKKISFCGFLLVLGIYPYLFLVNMVMPSTLSWGKNTYISAITVFIITIFLFQWKTISRRIPIWIVFLFLFLSTNIALINLLIYSEIKHIDVLRIPLNLLIYLGVAYSFTSNTASKKTIYNVILYSCIIQAVVGIIHYFYFPYIMTGIEGSDLPYIILTAKTATAQAERGLLVSPNVYALFLLLGCFLLVYRNEAFKKKWLLETIYMILLMTGVLLSNSRLGLIFSVILFFVYFTKSAVKGKVILAGLVIIGIIASHGFIEDRISYAYHRNFSFAEGNVGSNLSRTDRNVNALNLLISDCCSFIIGPSQNKTYEFKVVKGHSYSDNSFFLLAHNYGVPSAVIFIFVMFFLYSNAIDVRKGGTILFLIYFATALLVYNSILFDIWLLFFSTSLMILSRKSDKYDRLIVNERKLNSKLVTG